MNDSKSLKFIKSSRRNKYAPECPCGRHNKDGKFVPYEGYEDKGYCHSCGKTFLPQLPQKETWHTKPALSIKKPRKEGLPDFIPKEYLQTAKQKSSYQNNFIKGLQQLYHFSDSIINELIEKYQLVDSRVWPGAVGFPFIDFNGNLRQIKVMDYDPQTCKRVNNRAICVGKQLIKKKEPNLSFCFFGEHLLSNYPDTKVAIVEAEKTAIVASIYYPEFIWLATGGKNGCKWTRKEVAKVLKNRPASVYLFPDLTKPGDTINCYDQWLRDSHEIQRHTGTTQIIVNNLLEEKATIEERKEGFDLADYLARYDWRKFRYSQGHTKVEDEHNSYDTPLQQMQHKNPKLIKLQEELGLEIIDS